MEDNKKVELTEEQIKLAEKCLNNVMEQAYDLDFDIIDISKDKTEEERAKNLIKFRTFFDEVARFFGCMSVMIEPNENGMTFIRISQRIIQLTTNLVISGEVTEEIAIEIACVGLDSCYEGYLNVSRMGIMGLEGLLKSMGLEFEE
jgi:hypothetical protein